MPNYVETGRSHPLNHDILQITLIHTGIEKNGDQKRGWKRGLEGQTMAQSQGDFTNISTNDPEENGW